MKIAVLTLGCRTNQAESAVLEERLRECGHTIVSALDDADTVIINSCSVTASADRQSRQLITRVQRANARVILTGCYAELNKDNISGDNAITIVGNEQKVDIAKLIPKNEVHDPNIESDVRRHRPIIKIQDGCNNSCSYCIIPLARGRSRSIPSDHVISEVLKYERLGFDEIVLSGIHLGVYGLDLLPQINLEKLLTGIIKETRISRIRLSSIELSEVTDGLLDLMSSGRICNHLHIPLQGGTDKLLLNMRRQYNINDFRRGVDRILSRFDNIAIGTDVIVGFPGENDGEFELAVSNISNIPFSYMHVFPFSIRPGSSASKMSEQIDGLMKKKHVRQMLSIASSKKVAYIAKNVGLVHDMIVETNEGGVISGSTSNYIKVRLNSNIRVSPGRLIKIEIAEGYASDARGIPLIST
jgi:threonylcarbamoyladenosine tRNA methylthiotransferase MtaB